MPSHLRRTTASALLLLALLGIACSRSGKSDGHYTSLLQLVPDPPAFREGVTIVDYEARVRALPGYEASRTLAVTDEGLAADPDALSKALGWHGINGVFIGVFGADAQTLGPTIDNLETGFGFGLRDFDRTLSAGTNPARPLFAVAGSFDPEASRTQLASGDDCVPAAVAEHAGQTYFDWGVNEQNFERGLQPPTFDRLGRGGHLVIANDYLLRADSIETFTDAIDASQGNGSLLGDPDFALLAEAIDALDLVALFVSDRTQGPQRAAAMIEQLASNPVLGVGIRAAWNPPPGSTRLVPYAVFAIGVGVIDDEPFTTVVLVHESEDAAKTNVERLAQRLETAAVVNSDDGWADLFTSREISADGRVLTAVLRGDALLNALVTFEPLLLHE